MRRKGAGIGGLKAKQDRSSAFRRVGTQLQEQEIEKVQEQLEAFKENLETFAKKHKNDINGNPEFRKHFHEMCSKIGVDPLQSNKGFWSELLGFGSFYYEVGVQVTHVCMQTQSRNGGLIGMTEMTKSLTKMRGSKGQKITEDDVERAVGSLKQLKGGFDVVRLGSLKVIQSVPCELNTDHTAALSIAQDNGWVSLSLLKKDLNWSRERSLLVLTPLLEQSMVWVDGGDVDVPFEEGDVRYWFPSFVMGMSS